MEYMISKKIINKICKILDNYNINYEIIETLSHRKLCNNVILKTTDLDDKNENILLTNLFLK